MADAVATESVEFSRPVTLKAFEGRDYYGLPEEVKIGDKGMMIGLRNLSSRTRDTQREWMGYITKDVLGNLSLGHIRAGSEHAAQAVNIRDLTGLNRVHPDQQEYTHALDQEFGSKSSGYSKEMPLLIFGNGIGSIDPARLPAGVRVIPDEEFAALVHTHTGEDSFSPQDAYLLAEQQFRPDGRPQMPISIVVGPKEMYMMVIPTDGNVENKNPLYSLTGLTEGQNLAKKMQGLSTEEGDALIDNYIVKLCRERNFALYKGSLTDGVLKRTEAGIGKRLKEMGFSQVQIRRIQFNPNIPDPDLQISAVLSLKKEVEKSATLAEGQLVAQDFVNFMEEKAGGDKRVRIEPGSNSRLFILPKEGAPHTLAEVRIYPTGIEIMFSRSSFYKDPKAQKTQEEMMASLEEYYKERLSDRLPLVN